LPPSEFTDSMVDIFVCYRRDVPNGLPIADLRNKLARGTLSMFVRFNRVRDWTTAMPTLTHILFTLCVSVAAILAWQFYGDAATQLIVSSYPQAGWLAPRTAPIAHSAPGTTGLAAQAAPSFDQQRLNAISVDLDAMRQTVDRIAVTQEQITR